MMTTKLWACAVLAGVMMGAGGGWVANGWRHSAKLESSEHDKTKQQLAGAIESLKRFSENQEDLTDAIQVFQRTQQITQAAADQLDAGLRDLRGFTAGMRGDFAGLPERIATATKPALSEYISTCTAVFHTMAAGGRRLAEAGGGISRKADGHAADVVFIEAAGGAK